MAIINPAAVEHTRFEADPAVSTPLAADGGGGAPPILLEYWAVAKRWKWLIAGIVAAALIAGLIVTLLMTPEYTALARVEIDREQKQVANVDTLESSDASRDLEFYQTQYALLESRSLAERVARKLRLASNERFFEAHDTSPEDSSSLFSADAKVLSADQRAEREKQVVTLLLRYISIRPIRGSALIDIAYTSGSPDICALIANAWAQEFIQSGMDRRFGSASAARTFLENRLAGLRTKLEQSERDLVNYASEKNIVTITSGGVEGAPEIERTLVSTDLDALNQALTKATADRIAAESRARQPGSDLNLEALSNSAITSLRQKRGEVAADYARLAVQFEPAYPALRALDEQMRALDSQIRREEDRVRRTRATARSDEYGEAIRRENELRARVDRLKGDLDQQRRAGIQYNIYKRDVDTNRELYNGLLQRYKEIGVAGVGTNNVAIVDAAKVPDRPSSPNLPLNLALALLAGLVIAAGVVFALEQIDEGLNDTSEVSRVLHVPLLGGIPDAKDENAIDLLEDPKSMLSEAYLSVWSNLAFSTDHGVPRNFVVTSTRPAEGKSTSAIGLAAVMGRTGKRVVVVDSDMRSPSIHGLLGRDNARGMSNFLAGDDDLQSLIQDTRLPGVSVMTAGPKPPSAAELLSSERTAALMRTLAANYDVVVVDAPPILGLADAPLLARTVEGCVFVSEAGGTPVREIRASLNRLRAVQANIIGLVLTKLTERSKGYGYGYGYGYGSDHA